MTSIAAMKESAKNCQIRRASLRLACLGQSSRIMIRVTAAASIKAIRAAHTKAVLRSIIILWDSASTV
jgi:hypothetical protein